MGTESIGARSFFWLQSVARPKPSRSLFTWKKRTKLFEILTLKVIQRVTTKIELWVIVSSFFMRHKLDRKVRRPSVLAAGGRYYVRIWYSTRKGGIS